MVELAAKVIGALTIILLLVMWSVVSDMIPVAMGIGVNLIVIIGSILAGLFAYVTVMKS